MAEVQHAQVEIDVASVYQTDAYQFDQRFKAVIDGRVAAAVEAALLHQSIKIALASLPE